MKKQMICALIVASSFTAPVFGAVFATPSIMHTVSRNLEGRAIAADTPEEFEKYMLKSAAAEKKVGPLAATGGSVFAAIAVACGLVSMNAWRDMRARICTSNYSSAKKTAQRTAIFSALAALPTVVYFANLPAAVARTKKMKLYAKHAKMLHALMQDPEFKKRMGITSWQEVKRTRKRAEDAGISVQIAGSIASLVSIFSSGAHFAGFVAALLATPLLALGAKPLITRLMRKKGGAALLEKEFDKAIAAAERAEKEEKARVATEQLVA